MIRLIIFAPCEKLIVGADNHSSLISVIEHIRLGGVMPGQDLPSNAGLPYRWSVFALFHREAEIKKPTAFEAKIEMIAPSGMVTLGGSAKFQVSNAHLNYRSVFEFPIFPIAEPGIHSLKLYLKQKSAKDFDQIGEYPIRLLHGAAAPVKKVGTNAKTKRATK